MLVANEGVKFHFNNVMYSQIDGVMSGCPLGPVLANVFAGFHDNQFFENVQSLTLYYQYVDDTFTLFADEHEAIQFFFFRVFIPVLKVYYGEGE